MVTQTLPVATFTAEHPDAEAMYVILQPEGEPSRLIAMKAGDTSAWSVQVALPPGAYRYRYYERRGETFLWHGPAGAVGTSATSWSARLVVASGTAPHGDRRWETATVCGEFDEDLRVAS